MDNTTAGVLLALIGVFLGFITYKKYNLFWNFFNTRLLRKSLGDRGTTIALYFVSIVLIVTGVILAIGLVS